MKRLIVISGILLSACGAHKDQEVPAQSPSGDSSGTDKPVDLDNSSKNLDQGGGDLSGGSQVSCPRALVEGSSEIPVVSDQGGDSASSRLSVDENSAEIRPTVSIAIFFKELIDKYAGSVYVKVTDISCDSEKIVALIPVEISFDGELHLNGISHSQANSSFKNVDDLCEDSFIHICINERSVSLYYKFSHIEGINIPIIGIQDAVINYPDGVLSLSLVDRNQEEVSRVKFSARVLKRNSCVDMGESSEEKTPSPSWTRRCINKFKRLFSVG